MFGCSSTRTTLRADWINFFFDHATAYFSKDPLEDEEFVKRGKLNSKITDTVGVLLSKSKIKELDRILASPDRAGEYAIKECFLPRHGVVFWDKNQNPTGWVSVCFECNQIMANPKCDKNDLMDLKSFFKELGFPTYTGDENTKKN